MSETQFSICSRALVTLGARPISSFSESEGDTAITCGAVYPSLKLGIMGRHPWRFLMGKAELTRLDEKPKGEWAYFHQLPPDAISSPHAAFSSEQATRSDMAFEIFQRRVASNQKRVFMDYMQAVPESDWPAHFVDLMVKALCAEIAFTITDQQNVADSWFQRAYGLPSEGGIGGAMGISMGEDAQGDTNVGLNADAFVNIRSGGYF